MIWGPPEVTRSCGTVLIFLRFRSSACRSTRTLVEVAIGSVGKAAPGYQLRRVARSLYPEPAPGPDPQPQGCAPLGAKRQPLPQEPVKGHSQCGDVWLTRSAADGTDADDLRLRASRAHFTGLGRVLLRCGNCRNRGNESACPMGKKHTDAACEQALMPGPFRQQENCMSALLDSKCRHMHGGSTHPVENDPAAAALPRSGAASCCSSPSPVESSNTDSEHTSSNLPIHNQRLCRLEQCQQGEEVAAGSRSSNKATRSACESWPSDSRYTHLSAAARAAAVPPCARPMPLTDGHVPWCHRRLA